MVVTISKAGWDSLTQRERNVFKFALSRLQLGHPAIYVAGPLAGDARHYTFSDSRISPLDLAVLGSFAANRADLPGAYEVPLDGQGNIDRAQLRSDIAAWLLDPARVYPFVHPDNLVFDEGSEDSWEEQILAAQQAPAAIGAGRDPSWVPYEPEFHGPV